MTLTELTSALFFLCGFMLLGLKSGSIVHFVFALLIPAVMLTTSRFIAKKLCLDRVLLSITNFLSAFGILVLSRYSVSTGIEQAIRWCIGFASMLFIAAFVRNRKNWQGIALLFSIVSVVLLALPVVIGKEKNGAKNWISIAGKSFQPSEIVKVLLVIVLAFWASRKRTIAVIALGCFCLLLLMLQKDLGTALIYYCLIMIILFTETGSLSLAGIGLIGGAGAAYLGYNLFSHVKRRVAVYLNPWADPNGDGYQIIQSLIAVSNGGVWGTGLGVGNARVIPEYYNDFIFSAILNEFGWIFGAFLLLIYVLLIMRGVQIALHSSSVFSATLCIGCVGILALQTFIIMGGNLNMIPLTGVTLPFISSGGTSLLSALCLTGLMHGAAAQSEDDWEQDKAIALEGTEP